MHGGMISHRIATATFIAGFVFVGVFAYWYGLVRIPCALKSRAWCIGMQRIVSPSDDRSIAGTHQLVQDGKVIRSGTFARGNGTEKIMMHEGRSASMEVLLLPDFIYMRILPGNTWIRQSRSAWERSGNTLAFHPSERIAGLYSEEKNKLIDASRTYGSASCAEWTCETLTYALSSGQFVRIFLHAETALVRKIEWTSDSQEEAVTFSYGHEPIQKPSRGVEDIAPDKNIMLEYLARTKEASRTPPAFLREFEEKRQAVESRGEGGDIRFEPSPAQL